MSLCALTSYFLLFALPLTIALVPFDRAQMQHLCAELAACRLYIGTSSWKYPGWLDLLYSRERYEHRGKFANTRFERDCLSEYAETFKTVCVDAAYYDFPRPDYLKRLADAVPDDFQFGFKVTDAITVKTFPNLPRFGAQAGRPNPHFLNADLFAAAFLKPCEAIRPHVGILMFEFSRFWPADYPHGRDFLAHLDTFLSQLPKGWPYGIELRNDPWLTPEYFHCLSRHQVAHVFNSWQAVRSVNEQLALPGSFTNPQLAAARFLLKPGRKYEDAVKTFQPYDKIREVNDEARQAGAKLIKHQKTNPQGKTLIFVNNRLEGNALETITAMIHQAYDSAPPPAPPKPRPTTLFEL